MAQVNVTLDQVMLDLSFLLGETSVPIPYGPDRMAFIQRALDRVYRNFNWDLADIITTITLVNGAAPAPIDLNINDPILDLRKKNDQPGLGVGGDYVFTKIDYSLQDNYGPEDYVYWITGSPGAYIINTANNGDSATANAALTIKYMATSPAINLSIGTPFPSSMALARGALAYYRQAEDPQADISQVEALFQKEVEEVIGSQIRNQPDTPAIGRHQRRGTYIGDTDTPTSSGSDLGYNVGG